MAFKNSHRNTQTQHKSYMNQHHNFSTGSRKKKTSNYTTLLFLPILLHWQHEAGGVHCKQTPQPLSLLGVGGKVLLLRKKKKMLGLKEGGGRRTTLGSARWAWWCTQCTILSSCWGRRREGGGGAHAGFFFLPHYNKVSKQHSITLIRVSHGVFHTHTYSFYHTYIHIHTFSLASIHTLSLSCSFSLTHIHIHSIIYRIWIYMDRYICM